MYEQVKRDREEHASEEEDEASVSDKEEAEVAASTYLAGISIDKTG